MATRAEQYKSEEQRKSSKGPKRRAVKKPKKAEWRRDKHHADVKATHALEDVAPGKRPSRESTRASANRAKPDAAFNLTEETRKGSPRARAAKTRAQATRVRGKKS